METGLFWCNSRYYNPEWGRWISPDSIEYLDPSSINGLNLYCYCENDPVNMYDPSGQFPLLVLAVIAVALFTPIGGIVTQVNASINGYIVMAGIALGDLMSNNGEGAWADMCSINWNPFNNNESLVANSAKVSFYKGIPVFRTKGSSGYFMCILLTENGFKGTSGHYWAPEDILKHEWGHSIQQMTFGPIPYLINIGIPSAFIENR